MASPEQNEIERARHHRKSKSTLDLDVTRQDYALGYRFDVVLRGRLATPMEG